MRQDTDEDCIKYAMAAYAQTGEGTGPHAKYGDDSGVVTTHENKRYVILSRAVWGTLAVYCMRKDGKLYRRVQWPNAIDSDDAINRAVKKTIAASHQIERDYDRLRAAGKIGPIAYLEDKTPGTPR